MLQQSKAAELAAMTSTLEPTTSTTTTTTTTTTTMKPPPTTTPGQCSENDSVCELVGTVRLVGSGSEKWVPELLDHNTPEWKLLASEIETQVSIYLLFVHYYYNIHNLNLLINFIVR